MTLGALTLVEYSTPVEYSRSSKLDFYLQKSSFRILLTSFQNDSQCIETKKQRNRCRDFDRELFINEWKISTFDDFFRHPQLKRPPSADILESFTNIL